MNCKNSQVESVKECEWDCYRREFKVFACGCGKCGFFAFAFELMDRFDDGIVVIFTVPSKRDSPER